jgi:rod shape-determining protein MreB
MLNFITSLFSNPIYIQIWENRILVTNIDDQIIFDEKPLIAIEKNNKNQEIIAAIGNDAEHDKNSRTISNPFSHPRILVKDFIKAEKIIQHAIQTVHKNTILKLTPQVVIHPMERLDGGITDIE